MFEEHQLESLSDIATVYRKMERSLGYRNMRFQEYMDVNGLDSGADALYHIDELRRWKEKCDKWQLDSDGVVLLARDNLPFSRIEQQLKYPRNRIILHSQCCLTLWSVDKRRCDIQEFHRNMQRMDANDLGLK
jgi:hypothetical protein